MITNKLSTVCVCVCVCRSVRLYLIPAILMVLGKTNTYEVVRGVHWFSFIYLFLNLTAWSVWESTQSDTEQIGTKATMISLFTHTFLSLQTLTAYTWWNATSMNIRDLKLLKSGCSLASCCEEKRGVERERESNSLSLSLSCRLSLSFCLFQSLHPNNISAAS